MPPARIFISSVMRDFAAERDAARTAVSSLRLQPVMAEDFGAQPYSPQIACLEGVRSSDVYLGVFGARDGSRTASGKSATEEEFDWCALFDVVLKKDRRRQLLKALRDMPLDEFWRQVLGHVSR